MFHSKPTLELIRYCIQKSYTEIAHAMADDTSHYATLDISRDADEVRD